MKNRLTRLQEIANDASPKVVQHMVFPEMGGFLGYLEWAKKNADKFYAKYVFVSIG